VSLCVCNDGLSSRSGLLKAGEKARQTGVFGLFEHAAIGPGVSEQQARHGIAVRLLDQIHDQRPSGRGEQRSHRIEI
jgi:hypothetical protein